MIELRWLRPAPQDEPVFLDLLSETERHRAFRFHQAHDRLSYAAAHALLRTMLSQAAGGVPRAWRFAIAASGKPHLDPADGGPDLRFSLSHSRGMVACAVAPALDIGVDVEAPIPIADALSIARSHFSPSEADALGSMEEEVRSQAFLNLWTLKEAYLKATGQGVWRMREPEFDPRIMTQAMSSTIQGRAWAFRRFPIPGRSAIAEIRAGRLHVLS